ncbi:hypothetical protein GCM10011380_29770 [Sphingomonas metalli]|uniref:Antitoxin n=1 Tax=Sphingomonas metalli TaxID=1779358 RepID=A0A916TAU5_9SPHN|nr:type II toxin-antitoxin system Phd/YefM family antitoxin [Sphingomonas metalli]GGB38401.1 hypothetical protein GCM10011380_29770 [Sphingomonas metalli]
MRHVPIAAFKDKASEIIAAVEAGEEVVITRHGRDVVRLVGIELERLARQREAIDALGALGEDVRRRHGPTHPDEIRQWAEHGRA